MIELGARITQARQSRRLSLAEVSRDTRIPEHYLRAIETGDGSPFPAPIYARGFMRTYARYLALDLEDEITNMVESESSPSILPLGRQPLRQTLNFSWLGWLAVLLLLFGGGGYFLLLALDKREDSQPGAILPAPSQSGEPAAAEVSVAPQAFPTRGIEPASPGFLTDFRGVSLPLVLNNLAEQGLEYSIRDVDEVDAQAGHVIDQTPEAGAETYEGLVVELSVAAGTGGVIDSAIRTDCSAVLASVFSSTAERVWFEENCLPEPLTLPDRRDCELIRGTDYRSPREREFFLSQCLAPTP